MTKIENKMPHQFTDKQYSIYSEIMQKDWFMCILHGAKRTGKTIFNNYVFLEQLMEVRETANRLNIRNPQFILAGYSLGTIQKNVLEELTNMYGIDFSFDKYNRFKLFGVTIVQTGHGTIAGLGAIRGMTAFGAYINEASIADEQVFDEIKSRCSGEGARIVCDTNPDHPEHWLLKDYILNPSDSIIDYHFELDDNTFLSDRYRQQIKDTTPSGMFYDRNIKGLWVSGDGVVYADFNKDIHVVDETILKTIPMKEYFAGVDFGFDHYGAIVVIGRSYDDKFYLVEEHAHQYKQIEEWLEIAKRVVTKYGDIPFFCDSARPEYVVRFQEQFEAYNGNKRRMEGIETVAGLIKSDRFFVNYEHTPRFRQEIYNYVWHSTEDRPVKQFDDVMDAIRYAILSHLTIKRTYQPIDDEINTIKALGL